MTRDEECLFIQGRSLRQLMALRQLSSRFSEEPHMSEAGQLLVRRKIEDIDAEIAASVRDRLPGLEVDGVMLTCDLSQKEADMVARASTLLGTTPAKLVNAILAANQASQDQGFLDGFIPQDRPSRSVTNDEVSSTDQVPTYVPRLR